MITSLRFALSLSRLSIHESRSISTASGPVCFQMTNTLFAEPLKKKRKVDPAVVKMREDRKKRRLEKQIRRLEKLAKTKKPIEEIEHAQTLLREKGARQRTIAPITNEQAEQGILLEKAWCKYKLDCDKMDALMLASMIRSQEKALAELRSESEDLYLKAVQPDPGLMPYRAEGPCYTPPIENYRYPDGDYTDITKKFQGE